MERVPDCWRDCENENYKGEILRIRENISIGLDQVAENIFRIKGLTYGGKISEVKNYFLEARILLVSCCEVLSTSFSFQCEKCEYRKNE